MRLIVEPEAAYYAANRASDAEIGHILRLGQQIEEEIAGGKDRKIQFRIIEQLWSSCG